MKPQSIPDSQPVALPPSTDDFFTKYVVDKILSTAEKHSSSNTIIAFCHHIASGQLAAAKLFIQYSDTPTGDADLDLDLDLEDAINDYTKLSYETEVYRHITKKPICNTVRWISTQYYSKADFKRGALRKKLQSLIPAGLEKNVIGYKVLITERRTGAQSLDNLLHLPVKALKAILFQLIFSLLQATYYGFQNNDLRLGNLLIDLQPAEHYIDYQYRGVHYRVDVSEGKLLLFDWDLASCKPCGRNAILDIDYCPRLGMCNEINPRFDIYTALRELQIPDQGYTDFLKDVGIRKKKVKNINTDEFLLYRTTPGMEIPITYNRTHILQAWSHRMCNFDQASKQCIPYKPPAPRQVWAPAKMLKHPYFAPFIIIIID